MDEEDETRAIQAILNQRFVQRGHHQFRYSVKRKRDVKPLEHCLVNDVDFEAASLLVKSTYDMGRIDYRLDIKQFIRLCRPYDQKRMAVCARPNNDESEEFEAACADILYMLIERTNTSLYVSTYEMTNVRIVARLISAALHGVSVRMTIDKKQLTMHKPRVFLMALYLAGAKIRVDCRNEIHHHKLMVFDETKAYVTGSYNFSESAEDKNAENFSVGTDSKVVKAYLAVADLAWEHGSEYAIYKEPGESAYVSFKCRDTRQPVDRGCIVKTLNRTMVTPFVPSGVSGSRINSVVQIPVFKTGGPGERSDTPVKSAYRIAFEDADRTLFHTLDNSSVSSYAAPITPPPSSRGSTPPSKFRNSPPRTPSSPPRTPSFRNSPPRTPSSPPRNPSFRNSPPRTPSPSGRNTPPSFFRTPSPSPPPRRYVPPQSAIAGARPRDGGCPVGSAVQTFSRDSSHLDALPDLANNIYWTDFKHWAENASSAEYNRRGVTNFFSKFSKVSKPNLKSMLSSAKLWAYRFVEGTA